MELSTKQLTAIAAGIIVASSVFTTIGATFIFRSEYERERNDDMFNLLEHSLWKTEQNDCNRDARDDSKDNDGSLNIYQDCMTDYERKRIFRSQKLIKEEY